MHVFKNNCLLSTLCQVLCAWEIAMNKTAKSFLHFSVKNRKTYKNN